MTDFVSSFWAYFIAIMTAAGIIFCVWLLFTQRRWLGKEVKETKNTGHVWDRVADALALQAKGKAGVSC